MSTKRCVVCGHEWPDVGSAIGCAKLDRAGWPMGAPLLPSWAVDALRQTAVTVINLTDQDSSESGERNEQRGWSA